jgi:superfamily II DNA or RNA helicase
MNKNLRYSVLNFPNDTRMLDIVRDGLTWASEAAFSVSFVRCSGLSLLLDSLKKISHRDAKIRLLTSTYLNITQPDALESLLAIEVIECRVQTGKTPFHTKCWIFGENQVWVGSSNLTRGGLTSNIEWNLVSERQKDIDEARLNFEALWNRHDVKPLNSDLISSYREIFKDSNRNIIFFQNIQSNILSKPTPNPAQIEALEQLAELRKCGEKSAAIIAATGVGKTYLAAFDFQASGSKSLLYVSHRKEHLDQAWNTFSKVQGSPKGFGFLVESFKDFDAEILFASVQALSRNSNVLNRHFDYVVIDEFHHAAAPSYAPIKKIAKNSFLLGMTATPERQDGHDVLEWCNWNVAYEVRLPEAIRREWLLPFHYFGIADDTVDFEKLWRKGGFDPDALENALMIEQRVDLILEHAIKHGYDGVKRVTVGFCAGVRHARYMVEALTRRGLVAAYVDGSMNLDSRKEIYSNLEDLSHPLEWLFVSDVLNEGVDIPAINSLLFLRPTDSPTIFIQQLGRGLRLFERTEILTVLDFVGHHRNAWLALRALHDPGRGRNPSSIPELDIDPPPGCEVVLQDRTKEILIKIRKQTTSIKERWIDLYQQIRKELGRSLLPIDFLHREDVADLGHYRRVFKTWLDLQIAAKDNAEWSITLCKDSSLFRLLAATERDWQRPRVSAYALLWGMCDNPENPQIGFNDFFNNYPRWQVEKESFQVGLSGVKKCLDNELIDNDRLKDSIFEVILKDQILCQIEGRLAWTLDRDWKMRHGGILRNPSDLVFCRKYSRSEAVNHFGLQYDPQRHNVGVCWFGNECMIITKIDTSDAHSNFQYKNSLLDNKTFVWSSQNRQRRNNESGRRIIEHKKRGYNLHLFVQPRSHESAVYFGKVRFVSAEGDGPMLVNFELENTLPDTVVSEIKASNLSS